MLFCSPEFLFLFLPLTLIIYYVMPRALKNATLLALSLIFYMWGDISHLWLLLTCIAINFILGYLLFTLRRGRRALLTVALVFDIGVLAVFKYAPMVGMGIALPVGISFYTFQCISYVCDCYRSNSGEHSPISFAAYISLFPQLIAGPIVKYSDIAENLSHKKYRLALGIERFIFGLSKKMILANSAGKIFENAARGEGGAVLAWVGIAGYAFQIYFDFSGYSDMAIGLGHMLGFDFPENFEYPYISRSIREFWRRWHITLSSFFREYLYIPLGGSRRGRWRTVLNLMIVWSLTGLWHGAGFNFLLWGLYYFVLILLERTELYRQYALRAPRAAQHVITLLLILFGWLIFATDTPSAFFSYLSHMFSGRVITQYGIYECVRSAVFLAICAIMSTPLPIRLYRRLRHGQSIVLISLFILSVSYTVASDYNPFLYFRF